MEIKYLLLCSMALSLSSCLNLNNRPPHTRPEISKDTLLYIYKTEGPAECLNKADSDCTFKRYPDFQNQPALNDTLLHTMSSLFGNSHPDQMNVRSNIIRQDSSLTTLQISGHLFGTGKITKTRFINWNTKASKSIRLNDILKNDYQDKLNAIGEMIFKKQEKLSATASLANDYLFKNGKFSLNHNYLITPLGIRFLYDAGEIKPAAAGQTYLLIPYTQIKPLLQPHSIVKQYLK